MTRRNERIVVAVLGVAIAIISLLVGVQLLSSAGGGDLTLTAADPSGAVADASSGALAPAEGADGAESADGAVVVTTTIGAEALDDGASESTQTTASNTSSSSATATDSTTSTSSTSSTLTSSSSSTSVTTAASTSSTSTTVASTTSTSSVGSSSTTATASTTTTVASSTSTASTTTTSSAPPATLTQIEREIFRLTNELRTNPAGPLKRVGPTPQCVFDSEDIEYDPETGHPTPVPALRLSEAVSIQMARNWSQQMADADAMSHRPSDSQDVIYAALGIDWSARGENVAWAVGYSPSAVAQLFFSGWRESAGHYCNMISGAFTHIGVGHVRTDAGKDFATQNFYRPR